MTISTATEIEINNSLISLITKVLKKGERVALSLEGTQRDGTGFTNEREVVAPVTKKAIKAHVDDMLTTMENTPLSWSLKLVSPYVDPSLPGLRLTVQQVWNLGQVPALKKINKTKKAA